MAKKRHKKKHVRRNYSRSKGIGALSNDITDIAAMLAGGMAAHLITNKLLTNVMTTMPLIKNAAPIAGGLALKQFSKDSMMKSFASGMIVVGGINTIRTTVPAIGEVLDSDISGIEEQITVGDITVGELSDGTDEVNGLDGLDGLDSDISDSLQEISGSEDLE